MLNDAWSHAKAMNFIEVTPLARVLSGDSNLKKTLVKALGIETFSSYIAIRIASRIYHNFFRLPVKKDTLEVLASSSDIEYIHNIFPCDYRIHMYSYSYSDSFQDLNTQLC